MVLIKLKGGKNMRVNIESILTFFYALDSILLAVYVFFIKDFIYPSFTKKIFFDMINFKYQKSFLLYKIYILSFFYFLILWFFVK